MLPLTVAINKNSDGVFTVSPSGSIDSDTYSILQQNVDMILTPVPKILIFDMKNVEYISSMGIQVLLKIKNKVEDSMGMLVMINLQPQIRKVFDIIRAIPNKNIFKDREELDQYLAKMQQKEIVKRKTS